MTRRIHFLLLMAIGFIWIQSCTTERDPCLQPGNTVLRAGAYRHADTGTAILDTALPNPIFIALTNNTIQNAFQQKSVRNKFTFQLSGLADSCQWIIRPDSAFAVQDTLTFYYERQLHFLSNACGYTYFFHLLQVTTTRNAIDSLLINNYDITNDAKIEHLKIYY